MSSQVPFQTGDVVVHDKFGQGVVTEIDDRPSTNANNELSWKVTVDFSQAGKKKVTASFLKLEKNVHRIDELRLAADDYGKVATSTCRLLMTFGHDFIAAFGKYLHRDKQLVWGVPPTGEWKPDNDYRDAAFSTYERSEYTLDPVMMGVAVTIENLNDDGKLWVRVVVGLRKIGDMIEVSVGDHATVKLPVEYQGHIENACEMVFDRLLKVFTEDVAHNREGYYGLDATIGFFASKQRKAP